MEMFEKFFNTVLSEYGVFVSFLLADVCVLIFALRTVWLKFTALTDKFLVLVENNTKVITMLVEKIDEHNEK